MSLLHRPILVDSDIFIDSSEAIRLERYQYQCPKCKYLLRQAVQTSCGHWLCRECAEDIFASNPKPNCPRPECLEELTDEDGKPFFSDRAIQRGIGRFSVKCVNHKQGCDWSDQLKNLGDHLTTCSYEKAFPQFSSQEILRRSLQEGYVLLTVIKVILIGPPGVGKTSFKSLLFNWPPVLQHHSTGIASRPVQAVERMIGQERGRIWEKVSAERLLSMLAAAMNVLTTETPIISEDSDHNTSSHSSLVDSCSSIQATTTIPVQKTSKVQSDPSFYSEKIIKEIEKGELSGELYQSTWIYLLDSGGQPHFADVSRAFIRSNTVYTIAIKLTDKLSDKPPFLYSLEGKPLSNPNTELCMTNLQLIKHFVRSIVSSKSSKTGAKSLIFIVGTCFDLYSEQSKMESIKEKDEQLVLELIEFREHLVFFNELSGQLIHPVNNICKGQKRAILSLRLRKSIMSRIKKMEAQVPIRWFVFEILMKDHISEEGIISYDECCNIGKKIGMETFDIVECLKYFDSLSLVLYFPNVLDQVIFTNPQYLLDMLSTLISISFVNCYLPPGVQRQLQQKGIFEDSLLDELATLTYKDLLSDEAISEAVTSDEIINLTYKKLLTDEPILEDLQDEQATTPKFVPPLFTKKDFLKLLIYLRIVARISSTEYFIPAVLPVKEKKRAALPTSDTEPLVLQFKCGVVPQGVFLSMVVGLLNRKECPNFIINSKAEQLRHAIDLFSEDLCARVLLIEEFVWIEVHFWGDRNTCHVLKAAVIQAISSCAKLLDYDPSVLEVETKVLCQLPHQGSYPLHPVLINKKKCKINCLHETNLCESLSVSQSCWFNDIVKTRPQRHADTAEMSLSTVDHTEEDADYSDIGENREQAVIMESVTMSSANFHKTPTKKAVLEQLICIDTKWREVGNGLGLSSNFLDGLAHSSDSYQIKLEHVIQKWIELNGQSTSDSQASPVTWETILNVVKGPGLQNHALAMNIYKHLNPGSYTSTPAIPFSQDSISILLPSVEEDKTGDENNLRLIRVQQNLSEAIVDSEEKRQENEWCKTQ